MELEPVSFDVDKPVLAEIRGALESVMGRTLVGWLDDSHQPVATKAFSLRITGPSPRTFELAVTRVERADVVRALGLPAGRYGVQAELSDEVLALLAGLTDTSSAQVWVKEQVLGGRALLEAFRQRLQRPDGQPLAALESCKNLFLQGWVMDVPEGRARLSLFCNDQPLGHPVLREERDDVCQTLGAQHSAPGFRIELPGQLWRCVPAGEDAHLSLRLNSWVLGEPVVLRRTALAELLQPAARPVDLKQDRLHCLLVMEHLSCSGELPGLPEPQRQLLAKHAASLGLDLAGAAAEGASVASAPEARPEPTWGSTGRASVWMGSRWGAALALRWLQWLRARSSAKAEDLEVSLTHATGLFDKDLYDRQVSLEQRGGVGSLRHYVRYGDALSIPGNPLLSPRAYVSQLPGRAHPGINRLLHYALWGRFNGISPGPWFDLPFYLRSNPDVARDGIDPLLHFLRSGWREQRHPFAQFDITAQGSQPLVQRLARQAATAARSDALLDYLLRGLPMGKPLPVAGCLPWQPAREVDGRDLTDPQHWAGLRRNTQPAQVDVVVPVYAGVQETLACLHSVLSAPVRTPFELVVVDDCSPDPALSAQLRRLAEQGLLTLLVNERNLGFVRTVNRAFGVHTERDVVILNADAMVFNDWLDRMMAHLHQQPRAASVTPLSNNATICSYPRSLGDNGSISAPEAAALDRLAATKLAGQHAAAPSGVGFCMLMRRAVIQQIGVFDDKAFGRGYGEENDWCQRAIAAGWRNLLVADVYAVHQGSVSFADEADERVRAALTVLEQRHPGYAKRVDSFIQRNPLAKARALLDAHRLIQAQAGRPLVMQISHARGGGTARFEQEQALLCEQGGQGVIQLRPGAVAGTVSLSCALLDDLPNLADLPCERGGVLEAVLAELPLAAIQLHHLADMPANLHRWLAAWCSARRVPLHAIVHDYHMLCPRINLVTPAGNYCGEPDERACNACLAQAPAQKVQGGIRAWREGHARLLAQAKRITVPDLDVKQRVLRYFPRLDIQAVAHEPDLRALEPLRVAAAPRRILIVGALGVVKGYDVVLALARSTAAMQLRLELTLLGYSKDDDALRAAGVQVLGRYDDATLVPRLRELDPDLVFLPSIWPETYCYVLSAAFEARVQVACFDIGAQARRLRAAQISARILPMALAQRPDELAAALCGLSEPAAV